MLVINSVWQFAKLQKVFIAFVNTKHFVQQKFSEKMVSYELKTSAHPWQCFFDPQGRIENVIFIFS